MVSNLPFIFAWIFGLAFSQLALASAHAPGLPPGALPGAFQDASPQGVLRSLCPRPYDRKEWATLPKAIPGSEMTEANEEVLLLRLQKPGALATSADLGDLTHVLAYEMSQPHGQDMSAALADLIAGAMQTVAAHDVQVYQSLWNKYETVLSGVVPSLDSGVLCRTSDEIAQIQDGVFALTQSLANSKEFRELPSKYSPLALLTPVFRRITASGVDPNATADGKTRYSQLQGVEEQVAMQIAATATADFPGVYISKLAYMVLSDQAPLWGDPLPIRVDFDLIQGAWEVTPIAFSTEPISLTSVAATSEDAQATLTPYGFYAKKLAPIEVVSTARPGSVIASHLHVDWFTGQKPYEATVDLSIGPDTSATIDRSASPDYPALWRDGALTGLVFSGWNAGQTGLDVMNNYVDFFQKNGFKFQMPAEPVSDLRKFLADTIGSGEADYIIKEAHSSGDYQDMVTVAPRGSLRKGIKTLPDGRRMVAYILSPDLSLRPGERPVTISGDEFGDWIQSRKKEGQGPLIYVNSSCWSVTIARHEMPKAGADLVELPSVSEVLFFDALSDPTHPDADPSYLQSGIGVIMDGLLSSRSYADMRVGLEKIKAYRDWSPNFLSQGADHFVFPDEPDYKTYFIDFLQSPLEIQSTVNIKN